MFDNIDDIYNHIGQSMFEAISDEWSRAWLVAVMEKPGSSISFVQQFISSSGDVKNYSVNKRDGQPYDSKVSDAFYDLYNLMKGSSKESPWNKARFEVTSEGDFEVNFKFDEDFSWYKSLDIDSEEYDNLDIDIINQIKSWEGLPEEAPRYWK
ncbi:immunity protein YezG family protein [Endozoicomonas arenosclerae]|uniref:immunity protein YezG family protein n=1 Tax=Endozoicomonas arenosclerae TaxID=1633495 RepID=UPI000784CACF|nr:immunity protein YezG family protein [Endozoicomonas arenosclerae]